MVERGEDTASVGDHADSDCDKPDAHGDEESGRRVEPAPHIAENTGRMHEKSNAVALDTLQLPGETICLSGCEYQHQATVRLTNVVTQPDLKLQASAFEWALMCGLIIERSGGI
jgi:hypothetical protein